MKVCVMTTVHPPGDTRINREIRTLVKAGYDVVYIAPEGNFKLDRIKYISIKKYSTRKERFLKGIKDVLKKALEVDADVYHFHDPELLIVGDKLKKYGKKIIYDVHENYPELMKTKSWIPKPFRPIVSKVFKIVENFYAKHFDGIVVVIENMCERFEKLGVKCIALPNYPQIEDFKDIKKVNRNDGKVRFFYMGSIDTDRAIPEMIEAFKKLILNYENIEFTMVGPIYDNSLKELIEDAEKSIKGFRYHSPVSHEEVLKVAAKHDVGMVVYKETPNTIVSSPNKIFEYMYLGLPIIASDFPYWRKILDQGPCALYVNPNDSSDIKEKMERFVRNPDLISEFGENARRIVKNYLWGNVEGRLINLYKAL